MDKCIWEKKKGKCFLPNLKYYNTKCIGYKKCKFYNKPYNYKKRTYKTIDLVFVGFMCLLLGMSILILPYKQQQLQKTNCQESITDMNTDLDVAQACYSGCFYQEETYHNRVFYDFKELQPEVEECLDRCHKKFPIDNEQFEKKELCKDNYDSGYFRGWHESQFIDCSVPQLNQSMEIVIYEAGMGISYIGLKWEEMCKRLKEPEIFVNEEMLRLEEEKLKIEPIQEVQQVITVCDIPTGECITAPLIGKYKGGESADSSQS